MFYLSGKQHSVWWRRIRFCGRRKFLYAWGWVHYSRTVSLSLGLYVTAKMTHLVIFTLSALCCGRRTVGHAQIRICYFPLGTCSPHPIYWCGSGSSNKAWFSVYSGGSCGYGLLPSMLCRFFACVVFSGSDKRLFLFIYTKKLWINEPIWFFTLRLWAADLCWKICQRLVLVCFWPGLISPALEDLLWSGVRVDYRD